MYVYHISAGSCRGEEWGFPWNWCELPDLHAGNWACVLLQEQYVLFTAKPSFHPWQVRVLTSSLCISCIFWKVLLSYRDYFFLIVSHGFDLDIFVLIITFWESMRELSEGNHSEYSTLIFYCTHVVFRDTAAQFCGIPLFYPLFSSPPPQLCFHSYKSPINWRPWFTGSRVRKRGAFPGPSVLTGNVFSWAWVS